MDKKKNIKFLVCQIVVALIGLVFMYFNGMRSILWMYALSMTLIIPVTYFNYSLCKWENKWHSRWNERYPCNSEPSEFRLRMGKISEWALYILCLFIAIFPSIRII